MEPINYVCSLGTKCWSALWIKDHGMKKCSYPFDWIRSDPEIVIDCLEDDFSKFLDKDLHTSYVYRDMIDILWGDRHRSGHKIYGEGMFAHHDTRVEKSYNYYQRCVKRFRTLLQNKGSKLFILTLINQPFGIKDDMIKLFTKLYQILGKKTTNYRLLIVYHRCGFSLRKRHQKISEGLETLEIFTLTPSTGTNVILPSENKFFHKCILDLYSYDILDDIK